MVDRDLAKMYHVETKTLNQAVKRNIERFPTDFMFQFTQEEARQWQESVLRSQFVTLKHGEHIKYLPYVFTEQGGAMLSSVLNSPQAIQVNIQIIRIFTKLREILVDNKKLTEKLETMERKYDKHIYNIFTAIKELRAEKKKSPEIEKSKEKLGFKRPDEQ